MRGLTNLIVYIEICYITQQAMQHTKNKPKNIQQTKKNLSNSKFPQMQVWIN
jgi:hypothetical protein